MQLERPTSAATVFTFAGKIFTQQKFQQTRCEGNEASVRAVVVKFAMNRSQKREAKIQPMN